MIEARVDPETGDWNIAAPRRAGRPVDGTSAPKPCPFCPGNETMTPPEVLRVPADADAWQVRVVPNLYALVATDDPTGPAPASPPTAPVAAAPSLSPLPSSLPFTGRHEVVIESDRHDWDLRFGDPVEVARVLFAIRQRYRALAQRRPAAISVFRNYGARAGASLSHPHSQVVALDQTPPALAQRWRRAYEYFDRTGRCLHDDIAAAEREQGTRVVSDTDGVLIWQPHASAVPHQTVLLPTDLSADLANASDEAIAAVAGALPRVLTGLAEVLDDPAYNLVLHTGPANDATTHSWYHWHIAVYPRVTTPGGLEIATGVTVSPATPEDTAPALRRALPA
jgi:UDPglucose--hexose-1-phosphate uridylyltransferase